MKRSCLLLKIIRNTSIEHVHKGKTHTHGLTSPHTKILKSEIIMKSIQILMKKRERRVLIVAFRSYSSGLRGAFHRDNKRSSCTSPSDADTQSNSYSPESDRSEQ